MYATQLALMDITAISPLTPANLALIPIALNVFLVAVVRCVGIIPIFIMGYVWLCVWGGLILLGIV